MSSDSKPSNVPLEPSTSPDGATHAGGIVWRRSALGLEFLLVGSAASRDAIAPEWVLPKGHVEAGEGVIEAAMREVLEEGGVVVALGPWVGEVRYSTGNGDVRCAFFVMEVREERAPLELRPLRWATLDEVRAALPFPATVALVERAAAIVAST